MGIVGAAIGSTVPVIGTKLGFSIGVLAGSLIDAPKPPPTGHLNDLQITNSSYGSAIPWVFGKYRLGGTIIWASDFREVRHRRGSALSGTRQTYYVSSVDLAVMICQGPITAVKKIWGGEKLIYDFDAGLIPANITIKLGTATQAPITDMADSEGGPVPAYRNTAYAYLQNFSLEPWDNSIPNLVFLVENNPTLTAVSDDFNRANGNIGTATTGQAWVWSTVQGQIDTNRMVTTGNPGRPNWIDSGLADCTVQMTAAVRDPSAGTGFLAFRLTDEDNHWWFGDQGGFGSGTYELLKKVAGVASVITTTATVSVAGDVLKVVLLGNRIRCYVNGTLRVDELDTFQQTATKHGCGSNATLGCDDFSVTVASTTTPLSTILTRIFDAVGLSGKYNVTAATQTVRGFIIAERSEARSVVEPLLQVYFTDLTEPAGQLVTVPRGGAPIVTIDPDDYGAQLVEAGSDLEAGPVLSTHRGQELSLPFRVDFSYVAVESEYQQATQSALRYTKQHLQEQLSVNAPVVFTADEARLIPERMIYQAWTERLSLEVSLPLKYFYLCPGDVVLLPVGDDPVIANRSTLQARLVSMTMGLPGALSCRFVLDAPAVLTQEVTGGEIPAGIGYLPEVVGSIYRVWNGTGYADEFATAAGLYAAANGSTAGRWSGGTLYASRDAGASYQEWAVLADTATLGVSTSLLAAGTGTAVWDNTNTVDVTLTAGVDTPPVSRTDAEVLAGENRVVIGDELLAFGVVTSLGGNSYRLSHLLRGLRGTDTFWDEHWVGEWVVFDDGGIQRVEVPDAMGTGQILVKVLGDGQVLADVSPTTVQVYGRELLAYAPTQLTGVRSGGNDLTLSWLRRTRIRGDMENGSDVPLDFNLERYVVYPLPAAGTTITAITQAIQAVVTAAGHGLVVDDLCYLTGILGMAELNTTVAAVVAVSGTSFTIDVDTRGFRPWVSGGTVRKPTRTISVTAHTASFTSAMAVTDGLPPAGPVTFVIAQLNNENRRGFPLVGAL